MVYEVGPEAQLAPRLQGAIAVYASVIPTWRAGSGQWKVTTKISGHKMGDKGSSQHFLFPSLAQSVKAFLTGAGWLRGNSTRLRLPKGPCHCLPRGRCKPTLRVTQNGHCSAAGKELPSPLASGHNQKCALGTTSENT